MPSLASALVALVVLTATATANAQVAAPEVPTVVVSGEGVVTAVPDQAWVRIGAESRSKVSKDAQARNAEAMTAVQQKLAALGIARDAIPALVAQLERHGMTALGERQDLTLEGSRQVYELAV